MSCDLRWKAFPHSMHSKGFSPMWMMWCHRILFLSQKAFPHLCRLYANPLNNYMTLFKEFEHLQLFFFFFFYLWGNPGHCGLQGCCCWVTKSCLTACPWPVAHQAPLPSTIAQCLLKFMFFELVMLSNHLILCCPLLSSSVFPSIIVFSNELDLRIRWWKYWSFNFSWSCFNEYSVLIFFRIDWFDLLSKGHSSAFSSTTVQKHHFFGVQPSSWSNSHIYAWLLEKP